MDATTRPPTPETVSHHNSGRQLGRMGHLAPNRGPVMTKRTSWQHWRRLEEDKPMHPTGGCVRTFKIPLWPAPIGPLCGASCMGRSVLKL